MSEPWELWNAILAKSDSKVRLSEVERNIYLVNVYLCEIEQGGLEGLVYNASPDSATASSSWQKLRDMGNAVNTLGDSESASILLRLASQLELAPSQASWSVDPADSVALANCVSDLWDRLESYTEANRTTLELHG